MDELKLIDKLRKKANISYEEAKIALESNNWDILEALLYLEENGSVEKPSVSIFYTNELRYSGAIQEVKNNKEYNYKASNGFQGIFEAICKFIDTCKKERARVFKNPNYSSNFTFVFYVLDNYTFNNYWINI